MLTDKAKENIKRRLLEHRRIEGDCWIWTGSIDKYGYGKMKRYWGVADKVHRLAYEVYMGPIKNHILHKLICSSKACFNPDHLYDGTHEDNMRDLARYREGL